jgi:putative redox protein
MEASLNWQKEMAFVCDNRGIKTFTDANPESGGHNLGPTPKELVLNAMMGCTAMDVVSILKKMRQEITSFSMNIEADKTLEHPIHFKTALLSFHLSGNLDTEKILKAVDSSLTKYCGVNYIVSFSCDISYRVFLNNEVIKTGKVDFKK